MFRSTKQRLLTTVGLAAPKDFPFDSYEAVHARVSRQKDYSPAAWSEYAGGWNAVAYRFIACPEHDRSFTQNFRVYGRAPEPPHRYLQERELFGFFVSGQATLESCCYAL